MRVLNNCMHSSDVITFPVLYWHDVINISSVTAIELPILKSLFIFQIELLQSREDSKQESRTSGHLYEKLRTFRDGTEDDIWCSHKNESKYGT